MKSYLFKIASIMFFVVVTMTSIASSPPPPPPAHGASGNQCTTGGAPVGEGLFILLGLAGLYGGYKLSSRLLHARQQDTISPTQHSTPKA